MTAVPPAMPGEESHDPRQAGGRNRARRAARVAAVQALYQVDFNGADSRAVVLEFLGHRMDEDDDTPLPDQEFFKQIVEGAWAGQGDIDARLAEALPDDWPVARLDHVLRALLRAAVFELISRPDVPPRVAINEYIAIAHDFFSGKEPGMANAVLDRIARTARPEGFARAADPAAGG